MQLPPFQNSVLDFVNQHNLEIPVRDRMLDLTSEIGELAKEIIKASDYGRQDFQSNDAWHDELGDVFFSVICLANSTNTDLLETLAKALKKYQTRIESRGNAGSTTPNRNEC